MRVLQVARYGSVRGGAETYLSGLCEGLRAAGHTVALVYGAEPDMSRPEVRDGFHVPALTDATALREAVMRFAPDVVHVHVPDLPWVALAAAAVAPTLLAVHDHRLNCPVGTKYWTAWRRRCVVAPGPWCLAYNLIAHCGSLRANATLRPYRDWRAARAAASPFLLQVFSAFLRDELAHAGIAADRVAVTPYPVPTSPPAEAVDPGDPRPVVLASGRLNKEKGFHQLIDSLAFVRTRCHLVIVGEGHERAALERRAASAAGGHRITFTGWLSAGALAGWRARASLVAVPSMWPEPFGIVGLEAMASGKPVVAFDSGGIREWLDDGRTGRLVPTGDVKALGAAIGELLGDAEARARMGEAARARAEMEFSLAAHVSRVEALYERVRAEWVNAS